MSDFPDLHHVTDVEYLGGFSLRVTFDDGLVRDLDFEGRLWGPVFEPLHDPEHFARVFIEGETIAWPSGADIAPETLHGDFPTDAFVVLAERRSGGGPAEEDGP